jgi:membrane protein implicated in regulation of membrane protease activity
MALTGGMTLPWITGQAAAAWGLRPAFGVVALQFVAVLLLQLVTAGRAARASAGTR